MHPEPLIEAAALVADGSVPDWGSTSSHLSTDEERAIADELAVVARIAHEHRRLHELLPTPAVTAEPIDRARWGHLQLLDVIGRGSYGTVYRAWDGRLDRQVGLKLFHEARDPEAVMREGRMLARVRHDNVVAVYGADVFDGVAGIWMELLRGRSIDQYIEEHGPMSAQEATLVGLAMSRALAAIHGAGLLHCDLKAQNVIREPGGRLVLTDLGAARNVAGADDLTSRQHLTGTPRYMAPELFVEGPASPQSDLYSLGVLLYYLVTAGFPVDGRTLSEIKMGHNGRRRHLRDVRPDLPTGYLREVARALDANPQARHGSAGELEAGLLSGVPGLAHPDAQPDLPGRPVAPSPRARRLATIRTATAVALMLLVAAGVATWRWLASSGTPAPSAPRSIAVLPIRNLTGDPRHDYLADGVTEVLISNLARIRGFSVPSIGAVSRYRGQAPSAASAAGPLGVELLLAGSIVEAGSRVRMTINLLDRNDRIVYGDELTLAPSEILSGQAEIASRVAHHLAVDLSAEEAQMLALPALDARAQDAYLKGLVEAESGLDASIPVAAEHFRAATELAPAFAPGWAGRAMMELRLAEFADAARRFERVERARQYAERALEVDASSPAALLALGTAQFYYDWDFEGAEQTLQRALEEAPRDATTLNRLALLQAALGRTDEAVELGTRVVRLEPLVPKHLTTLGLLHYYRREYERAAELMHQSLRIAPENPLARFGLGLIHAAQGQYGLAADQIRLALGRSRNMAWLPELACVLAAGGHPSATETVQKELAQRERLGETYSIDHRAHVAAAEGRLDEGFEFLQQAVEQRVPSVLWMQVDPRLDRFRSDPRFDQLVRRAQLRQ